MSDGYAAPTPTPPPARNEPPPPVRLAIRYVPDIGWRRVFLVTDDVELDISSSIVRFPHIEIDPRGPSKITVELSADVDELDWVYQTVAGLGDPLASVDRADLRAVVAHAMANSGFAEKADDAVTTAVLEHLRAVFATRQ